MHVFGGMKKLVQLKFVQLLLMKIFQTFDFELCTLFTKMCPNFVGSVHNFGKSEDDII